MTPSRPCQEKAETRAPGVTGRLSWGEGASRRGAAMATTTRGPGTTIAAGLLPEFEREMAATRACLERVPMADSGWKPHPRSMSLGQVSTSLAVLPSWTTTTIGQASLDLAGPPQAPTPPTSRDALLELFDRNVADARAALAGASDHHLTEAWTLCQDGKT